MKNLIVALTGLVISSFSVFAQELKPISAAEMGTAYPVKIIITKDTSWVSERRTQSMGGVNRSGNFQTLPGYRITNVEFRCEDKPSPNGGACPWNYNPTGGYQRML